MFGNISLRLLFAVKVLACLLHSFKKNAIVKMKCRDIWPSPVDDIEGKFTLSFSRMISRRNSERSRKQGRKLVYIELS